MCISFQKYVVKFHDERISVIVEHFNFNLSCLLRRDVMSIGNFNFLSVSFNEHRIQYETYDVIWHVAPEYNIQMVNWELSPKSLLELLSLSDIRAIDTYTFWSLSLSPFSGSFCDARLSISLKRMLFRHFFVIFRWFRKFINDMVHRYASKIFERCTFSTLFVQITRCAIFSLSFLFFLKHISAEWLVPPQKVYFYLTIFSPYLFLL